MYDQTERAEYAGEPDRAPGIVDEFRQVAEAIAYELERLTKRLAPVMRPDYDAEKTAVAPSESPRTVTSDVRGVYLTLERHVYRIQGLLERLEV